MYWNTARPGVGLKPRRESQRPQLPQHARHCPVLEAGSGLGFLVYPSLEPFESFFNAIERPAPPVMVVRVETDWYMHETEFRYVLQPGEGISAARTMPIGQVFFVPREEIGLIECTAEELAEMRAADEEFGRAKAAAQVVTPYGLPYSPHYLKESRARQKEPKVE